MIRPLILLLLTVTLSFTLVSCGVKKTAPAELGDLSYSSYSSCNASAKQRRDPVAGGVIDSGYFGKLVNRSSLNAILPTDIQQTAAHASQENLSMYVVSQNECSVFSFLPYAPSNVYSYWKEAAGAAGVSSLLGLYKEDCGSSCRPNQVINPLVLLNACTDRWTMVHEMLHHNFNVQRKKFKPFDSDEAIIAVLMNELNLLQDVIDGYNRAPSEFQGMQVVHSLDRVRDLLSRFTYQTSFEEVSIESILLREYSRGRLQNVPSTAIKNAIGYIRYSTAAGVDRLASIRAAAVDLAKSASANNWRRVATNARIVKAKIDNFEDDSTCYQNEAVDLYREASLAAAYPTDIVWNSLSHDRSLEIAAHVESHVHPKANELTKKIDSVLSTLKP